MKRPDDGQAGYFDALAATFDEPRRAARAALVAQAIAGRVGSAFGGAALEYGCGTGLVGLHLAPRFARLTMMDASGGMVARLAEKARTLGLRNVEPVRHDLVLAPWDGRYAAVFTSMALHHIVPVEAVLRSLAGLLTPGGMLCVVDLDEDDGSFHRGEPGFAGHNGFSHAWMARMLAAAGLDAVCVETFYRDAKMVGGAAVPYGLFCASGAMR